MPMELVGDELRMCGIEVFRVAGGRITDVWDHPPMAGHWGWREAQPPGRSALGRSDDHLAVVLIAAGDPDELGR